MIPPRAEGDERAPVQPKGGESVAELDVVAFEFAQQLVVVVAGDAKGGAGLNHAHHQAQHRGGVGAAGLGVSFLLGSTPPKALEPTARLPTVIAMPKPFHVVFPEGFTRVQMAGRADQDSATITARGYLAATASSPLPGQFAGDDKLRSLEGFHFVSALP